MRIGIMGGTFDPIHNGHLMLGEYAYQQFHLDEVWYMPNGNPPHKSNPENSSPNSIYDTFESFNMDDKLIPFACAITKTPESNNSTAIIAL